MQILWYAWFSSLSVIVVFKHCFWILSLLEFDIYMLRIVIIRIRKRKEKWGYSYKLEQRPFLDKSNCSK